MADPTSTATNPVLDFLSKWSPLWLLLLGGLLAQLWNRFRTRIRRFTWKASHNRIAIASDDPFWGNVTVQYNGIAVNHLHHSIVELTNDGSEDQKDVVLTLSFQDALGHIIGSVGTIEGCIGVIPLDPDYLNLFHGATPQQAQALSTYVVHKIPVFNRRQKATFNLLVARDDASIPLIQVSCNHPGVMLEFLPSGPEVNGVPFNVALGAGLVITPAMILLLARYELHSHPYFTSFVGWFLGLCVTKVGAGVVRGWKMLVRLLG